MNEETMQKRVPNVFYTHLATLAVTRSSLNTACAARFCNVSKSCNLFLATLKYASQETFFPSYIPLSRNSLPTTGLPDNKNHFWAET
jgi:hypothetical protein